MKTIPSGGTTCESLHRSMQMEAKVPYCHCWVGGQEGVGQGLNLGMCKMRNFWELNREGMVINGQKIFLWEAKQVLDRAMETRSTL
jgi:hypothetical protein